MEVGRNYLRLLVSVYGWVSWLLVSVRTRNRKYRRGRRCCGGTSTTRLYLYQVIFELNYKLNYFVNEQPSFNGFVVPQSNFDVGIIFILEPRPFSLGSECSLVSFRFALQKKVNKGDTSGVKKPLALDCSLFAKLINEIASCAWARMGKARFCFWL